ncbi:thiosulfate/3-mercaptopyruvate sulfurtransferase [Tamaricihabitans halophyticus]|uniref:Thiosulfate/3-mercaptopyruvate sulfurtransferase n=1 Tax=Tamaricihabitans halophyticus TaxID=1262583 RepID=A0A4V2SUM5_9PSEU|nr:sulfurtransferase [Tamaricihabitans halophyticus]TCP55196.1 thiosulfate/3-mercaptopyruvate sulfurtransferase [Tamaricihabitans halophyticus]
MRPLITTTELAGLLGTPEQPTLLDIRWRLGGPPGHQVYKLGHLPGAVFLDMDTELAGPPGNGGRHPLPEPTILQRALRRAGVRADHPVVVYDDADGSAAARAWWLLRWAGHSAVALLDGGYAAWRGAGHAVTTVEPEPTPGDIQVRPGAMPVLDAEQAAELATAEHPGVLLDARAAQRYAGHQEPIDPRAGHIPGARNAPISEQVDAAGHWLSPAELAERFATLGVRATEPVGAYCGSGITAASLVLALEVAGHPEPVALYSGSWSHWCTDPNRPVATGETP